MGSARLQQRAYRGVPNKNKKNFVWEIFLLGKFLLVRKVLNWPKCSYWVRSNRAQKFLLGIPPVTILSNQICRRIWFTIDSWLFCYVKNLKSDKLTKSLPLSSSHPSVQHQIPLSSRHPSVPHQKPLSSTHRLELNWGLFGVELKDFGV